MITIPVSAEPRLYELTYILPANLTDSELKSVQEEIAQLVTKHEGEIVREKDWGKRELAYKIRFNGKRHEEGVYTHLVLRFMPDKVQRFENELKLSELVMRHLLVVAEAQTEEEFDDNENQGEVE